MSFDRLATRCLAGKWMSVTLDIQSKILVLKVAVSWWFYHMQIDDAHVKRALHLENTSACSSHSM